MGMNVRRESLPRDIVGEARKLWEQISRDKDSPRQDAGFVKLIQAAHYLGDYARLKANDELHRLDDALAEHDSPLTDIEVLAGWGAVWGWG